MGHQRDLALSARSFLRPVTSRRIPLNPDLGYWGGVTWVFRASGTASGANAAYEIDVSPGEGNEMEFLYGQMSHASFDAAARSLGVDILDPDGNTLAHMIDNFNVNTQVRVPLPYGATLLPISDGGSLPVRGWIVSGEMIFRYHYTSLAATDALLVQGVFRVRGQKPTVKTAGAGIFNPFTVEVDRFV